MMCHAGRGFVLEKVDRWIGHVDDHRRSREGLCETLARHRRSRLMTLFAEPRDQLRSDEAGAADDRDLHGYATFRLPCSQNASRSRLTTSGFVAVSPCGRPG